MIFRDGNCFYYAVADQLSRVNERHSYLNIKRNTGGFIRSGALESFIKTDSGLLQSNSHYLTLASVVESDKKWVPSEQAIMAVALAHEVHIRIHMINKITKKYITMDANRNGRLTINIGYVDECHYVSLKKLDETHKIVTKCDSHRTMDASSTATGLAGGGNMS
jgi:hypothetical protein